MLRHDDLGYPSAAEFGAPRCATCEYLEATPRPGTGGSLAVRGCALREVNVAEPASTCCANHPDHVRRRDRVAVGPVVALVGGELTVVAPSPDRRAVRDHLLDLLEEIGFSGARPLTFRERMALGQAREFGDRRHAVHLDRIDAGRGAAREARPSVESAIVDWVVGEAVSVDEDTDFIEAFTVPGRLLILSSLVVGAVAFWGAFALYARFLGSLGFLHLAVLTIPATLVAALYLKLGVRVFRWTGIAFRAND